MQFCVLVEISRRCISLWYQTEGKDPSPLLIKGSREVPLYFYVDGNDFLFGSSARDRFLANDPKAYGHFFEIVKDPAAHFTMYGNKRPVKQLLYYGLEQCFSYFINTVLYKNDSIESYRPAFPLRFVFAPDIEDKEKILVENLFTEAGYNNVATLNKTNAMFAVLVKHKLITSVQPVLLLTGVDGTLYLHLYKRATDKLTSAVQLAGLGSDPRVRILARMIVEYIQVDQSYLSLDIENEVATILPSVTALLENMPAVVTGEVALSDGRLYYYNVRKSRLSEQLLYDSSEYSIHRAIEELLMQQSVSIPDVCILLLGKEVNTSFFIERLCKVYPAVKGITANHVQEAMQLLFDEIAAAGYATQPKNAAPVVPPPVPKIAPPVPKAPVPPPIPSTPRKTVTPVVPPKLPGLGMLIGKAGTVTQKLSPVGKVSVEKKEYDAKSMSIALAAGTPVKVMGTEGTKYLLVERSGSPPLPFQKNLTISSN